MRVSLLVLTLLLTGCPKAPPSADHSPSDPHGATTGVDDPELAGLLLAHWEWSMEASPVWATRLGDHRYDDRIRDRSPAADLRRAEALQEFVDAAEQRRASIVQHGSERDRTTVELFLHKGVSDLARRRCRMDAWNVAARSNAVGRMESMVDVHPIASDLDHRNLAARLRATPADVAQEIELLRGGLTEGLVANAESIRRVIAIADAWLAQPADEHDPTVQAQLEQLTPAFTAYRAFLHDELLPAARTDDRVGLAHLPIGASCYATLAETYTNGTRPPTEIHQTGLDELARIHEEFAVLGERLWEEPDRAAIFARLRTDPELFFATEEEVEGKARTALSRARDGMGSAFGTLPQAECTVEPIPALEAPFTTIAYYRRPAPDGSRPGTYFVNTYAPTTRPRHEAEVLAFHESIPGHHLQIAIAQELGDLPAFRRNTGSTAFVEGWGLYTERLADEMGLYSGDLDRMGMLSFDAWRAARLVVDTGLHHHGWSRQQAIDFLAANTPLPLNNIDNEVDRYITTPGQALAYKTGQLEILALRAEAEAALGERFDLSAFHDELLGGGAVTLGVLRARMERWVEGQSAR